jgi:hypothetical protein
MRPKEALLATLKALAGDTRRAIVSIILASIILASGGILVKSQGNSSAPGRR